MEDNRRQESKQARTAQPLTLVDIELQTIILVYGVTKLPHPSNPQRILYFRLRARVAWLQGHLQHNASPECDITYKPCADNFRLMW